jgi:hypothetical protein
VKEEAEALRSNVPCGNEGVLRMRSAYEFKLHRTCEGGRECSPR